MAGGNKKIPGPVKSATGSSTAQKSGKGTIDPSGTQKAGGGQVGAGSAGGGPKAKMFAVDPVDVHDPGMIGKKKGPSGIQHSDPVIMRGGTTAVACSDGGFGSKPPTMAQRNAATAAQQSAAASKSGPPVAKKASMKRSK